MSNSNNGNTGNAFFGLLGIVFITLKLTGTIGWSWWWVTAPLWGPLAVGLVVAVIAAIISAIVLTVAKNRIANGLKPGSPFEFDYDSLFKDN